MLLCKACLIEKDEDCFSKKAQCKAFRDTSRCKDCKKAAWDWKQTPVEKRIFNRIAARARKHNLAFNLTIEDINLPELCPVLKKPFIYGDWEWTYSVDRIDNNKGYVKGNIIIVSNRANRLKNNATLEDFEAIIEYYGLKK